MLDELADAYIDRVLKDHRVKEPDDGADLHAWTDLKTTTKGRGTRRHYRRDILMAAFALREIRALQSILANGDPRLNETVDRLLFVCGPKGSALQALFADTGHAQASARGRTNTIEHRWKIRLPLIEKAAALQAVTPDLTNEQAAQRIIAGLDQAVWNALMRRRIKPDGRRDRNILITEPAKQNQTAVLAEMLGHYHRVMAKPDDDEMREWEPDVRFRIMWRQAVQAFPRSANRRQTRGQYGEPLPVRRR